MNSDRIGVKKRGRLRRRWQQDIDGDLRILNVRRWKEKEK